MSMMSPEEAGRDLERMQAEFKELEPRIEYHCRKHGVVRNVSKSEESHIVTVLSNFYGRRCAWHKSAGRGFVDLEFVDMSSVYPPPKRPWEWCGETVLFKDWQHEEKANRQRTQTLNLGDMCWFNFRGEQIVGTIAGFGRSGRVTVVSATTRMKYYMPARSIHTL